MAQRPREERRQPLIAQWWGRRRHNTHPTPLARQYKPSPIERHEISTSSLHQGGDGATATVTATASRIISRSRALGGQKEREERHSDVLARGAAEPPWRRARPSTESFWLLAGVSQCRNVGIVSDRALATCKGARRRRPATRSTRHNRTTPLAISAASRSS